MSEDTLVTCVVKSQKGVWHGGTLHPEGTELELQPSTVVSGRKRGNLYEVGEYEKIQAGSAAALKAAQAEKNAREPEPEPEPEKKSSTKPQAKSFKGTGSKGS